LSSTKNILICITGLTPQIVTETLFCLSVKNKIPVNEIYVLTTSRGRDVILGKDKHTSTPKTPLNKEITAICKKYKIRKPLFAENEKHIIVAKEESVELPDIRTDKDNILFPNKAAEFIREKSSDPENTLYCSITGGRKSMSVHLANAISLFARPQDKLLHVLTKEEHEFKGFYPKSEKEIEDLEISEIPFVRLRSLLSSEMKDTKLLKYKFDKIVKVTQRRLKVLSNPKKLIIDIEKRELRYANESLTLEPMEFLFYYYFVDIKNRGKGKINVYDFILSETKDQFISYFEEFYPYYYINEKNWYKKGFSKEYFNQRRSKVNKKITGLIDDKDIADNFIINVNRRYRDSKYFIKADKNNFIIKI